MHYSSPDALSAHPQGRGLVAQPSASRTDRLLSKIHCVAPTRRLLRCALAVAVLLACASPLRAGTFRVVFASNAFNDVINWDPTSVPGASDQALFYEQGPPFLSTYSVFFGTPITNQRAEPSTVILAAIGLVGLAAFGRRRRKQLSPPPRCSTGAT